MPKKIKQLITDLNRAGFENRGGKGSHRNFSKGAVRITISGNQGADAKPYQEAAVKKAIKEAS